MVSIGQLDTQRDLHEHEQAFKQLHERYIALCADYQDKMQECRYYRSLLDSLPSHIAVLDETGKIIAVNKAWKTFSTNNDSDANTTIAEGANYLNVCDAAVGLNAEEAPLFAQAIRSALAGTCEHFALEYPCNSPTTERWFIGHVTRLLCDGPPRVVVTHDNITQRKQMELALQRHAEQQISESEERYRTLVETSPSAILLTNVDTTIQFCNQQAVRLFGYMQADELLGKHAIQLIGLDRQIMLGHTQTPFESGTIKHIECMLRKRDGSQFPAEISSSVVTNKHGDCVSLIFLVSDISQRKQLQARVIEYERFAANAKLTATVAHEVNSPLQTIQSILEVIDQVDGADRTRLLPLARAELERISQIVCQLLDLYRPDASTPGWVDMNALIERVLLLNSMSMSKCGIQVESRLAPNLPTLWGRTDQLTQVFINLFFNAMSAMPNGGILKVHTTMSDRCLDGVGACQPCMVIRVYDTGIGIASDIQARIFEPFFTTREGGTGLGLSISQQIVSWHGGYIEVESEDGVGSMFILTFPIVNPYCTMSST